MFPFKKKPQELLREEAAWRLRVVIEQHNPRMESRTYLSKHGFGDEDQTCHWHWDDSALYALKPDMLVALAKQHVLEPDELARGITDQSVHVSTRALVRAIIDLEGTQGFNHGYDDGYQRGASLAVQRVKEWIDRRAREFVFSPASMIPALKAEVKLDDLKPET